MRDCRQLDGQRVWVMAKGYHPDEGGMQTYAAGVAEAYAAAGAKVTVFTQTSAGPRDVKVGAVRLVDLGAGRGVKVPFHFWRAMRRELQRTGPPLFTHGTTWRTSTIPLALRLPYITTFHGREFMYARGLMLALMRLVARRAKRCVAVSHHSAEKLVQRLHEKAAFPVVAWNGLSGWDFPPRSVRKHPGTPMILSLCRLEPRKNLVACVNACAALRDEGHRFCYVIAGRGPDLEHLGALVRERGLEDVIEVAGFVTAERAAQLYADADIFLHPQIAADDGRDFEGFGIAIADAMLAGATVVVGEEGGAKELVVDGHSGLIVDGRDTSAISKAVRRLLRDRHEAHSIAQAGRVRAQENFAWARHVAEILQSANLAD